MLDFVVQANTKELQDLTRNLSKSEIAKAANSSLNKTITSARVAAKKEIKKVYNISTSQMGNDVLPISKSTTKTLTAKVSADKRPISLTNFSPVFNFKTGSISVKKRGKKTNKTQRVKKMISNPQQGLTVEVLKGERKSIPYAFLIKNSDIKPVFARGSYTGSSGNYSFIKRHKRVNSTASDTPITKLNSASISGAIKNDKVNASISKVVAEKYEQNMIGYIKGVLKK